MIFFQYSIRPVTGPQNVPLEKAAYTLTHEEDKFFVSRYQRFYHGEWHDAAGVLPFSYATPNEPLKAFAPTEESSYWPAWTEDEVGETYALAYAIVEHARWQRTPDGVYLPV